MSNLINAYHPHNTTKNQTCKELLEYIKDLYQQAEVFGAFRKHDGVSIPVSLNIDKNKLGIKRNINKKPVVIEDIESNFSNKDSVLRGSNYILQILENKKSHLKKLNVLKNPNRVLMFEYIEPEQNIILHKQRKIIYLGMFKITNNKLVKLDIPELVENELLLELNRNSEIELEIAKLCKLNTFIKTFNLFIDELKSIKSYKNLNFETSLYDEFNVDIVYEKRITNLNRKSFLTTSIGYYNKIEEISTDVKFGILATLIIKIAGDILKKEIDSNNNCEGYILYDFKKKKYIKFVGSFIEKRNDSFFAQKKRSLPPLLPFIG